MNLFVSLLAQNLTLASKVLRSSAWPARPFLTWHLDTISFYNPASHTGLPHNSLLAILWAHPASSAKEPLHLLFPFWHGLFLDSRMAHSLMSFTAVLEGHLWPVWPFFLWLFCIRCDPSHPISAPHYSLCPFIWKSYTHTPTHTHVYPLYDWSLPAIVLVSPWREPCCRGRWYFKKQTCPWSYFPECTLPVIRLVKRKVFHVEWGLLQRNAHFEGHSMKLPTGNTEQYK